MKKSVQKKTNRSSPRTRQLNTPEVYADHVVELIESATPRKRKLLSKEGIFSKVVRDETIKTIRSCASNKKCRKVVREQIRATTSRVKKPLQRIVGVSHSFVNYKSKPKMCKQISADLHQDSCRMLGLISVSTQMPNRRRTKDGVLEPLYILQRSIKELHQFLLEHAGAKIGLVTFGKLRPNNVKLQHAMKWLQCICDICNNVESLLKAIRLSMSRAGVEVPDYFYSAKKIAESSICSRLKYNTKCVS